MILLSGGVILLVALMVTQTNKTNQPASQLQGEAMERVEFQTSDGVMIVGDVYHPQDAPKGGIILLHMMPTDRTSWSDFAQKLSASGYLTLAIDLRGHGESVKQATKTLDFNTFSSAEHQASKLDVEAALAWLKINRQLNLSQIGLVGASIGANLAIGTLANHPEIPWGALLSPGLDYRGITTEPQVAKLSVSQRLYMVTSDNDIYSLETVRRLKNLASDNITVKELSSAGHGTDMLDKVPGLDEEIIVWMTK